MTDPVLRQNVRDIQNGNKEAISDICRHCEALIRKMVKKYYYLCRDREEARSIAVMGLIESAMTGDLSKPAVFPELFAGVRNTFRRAAYRYELEQKHLERTFVTADGRLVDLPETLTAAMADTDWDDPEACLLRKETREQLQRALSRLKAKERFHVCRRVQDTWPYHEIQRVSGYPIPTIQSSVNRALKKLRSYYGAEA